MKFFAAAFLAVLCLGGTAAGNENTAAAPDGLWVGRHLSTDGNRVEGVERFRFPEGTGLTVSTLAGNTVLRAGEGATHDVLLRNTRGMESRLETDASGVAIGLLHDLPEDPDTCWACQSFADLAVSVELLGCFVPCTGCICEECVEIPCSGSGPGTDGDDDVYEFDPLTQIDPQLLPRPGR